MALVFSAESKSKNLKVRSLSIRKLLSTSYWLQRQSAGQLYVVVPLGPSGILGEAGEGEGGKEASVQFRQDQRDIERFIERSSDRASDRLSNRGIKQLSDWANEQWNDREIISRSGWAFERPSHRAIERSGDRTIDQAVDRPTKNDYHKIECQMFQSCSGIIGLK